MPQIEENISVKLAVVLASYNRKEKTLACIQAVTTQAQDLPALRGALRIVLVDDGSTDGTADEVLAKFPYVQVIRDDGSLFWCRSMHKAQAAAMAENCDYLLWLNDDTELAPDALSRLFQTEQVLRNTTRKPVVIVGSLCDPDTGRTTYGGMMRMHWWQRTNLKIATPGREPIRVDSMNGNCVLIPSEIAKAVGNLDYQFEHAMGDMDYGFRIVRAGFSLWVMPGYVGTCRRNSPKGTYIDDDLPLSKRWRHILSPKGLPPRSLYVFARRHGGLLWPVYWAWPYIRVAVSAVMRGRLYK